MGQDLQPNRAMNPTVHQRRCACWCPAGYRDRSASWNGRSVDNRHLPRARNSGGSLMLQLRPGCECCDVECILSRRRLDSVCSCAPSVGPAPRVWLPGGGSAVAASCPPVLAVLPRNWQSIPPQGGASSSFRGAEGMRHSRRKYEHPLQTWSAVPPMTPNRALNRTLNQRRYACWFRAG